MATSISAGISQYNKISQQTAIRGKANTAGTKGLSKEKATDKKPSARNIFGQSATLELSPEVEKYGRVVDLLQKKYDNADVFVAGPDDDLSLIGGDLEYSIIISEDEMNLLASEDPKNKESRDALMGKIDDAMKSAAASKVPQ